MHFITVTSEKRVCVLIRMVYALDFLRIKCDFLLIYFTHSNSTFDGDFLYTCKKDITQVEGTVYCDGIYLVFL